MIGNSERSEMNSVHAAGCASHRINCLVLEALANVFLSLPRWTYVRLSLVHITLRCHHRLDLSLVVPNSTQLKHVL